jgi:glycosyltransferase involved in cell wall biosynthesis
MPLVSIIIPTYNSERDIAKCITSISSQSFKDFEIIIQDGLSEDRTLYIVNETKKQFPFLQLKVFSEKDFGIYDAMNKALKKVEGEWIYFLGSDDELYQTNVLEEVFNDKSISNYKVIYGNVKVVGNTSWAKDGEVYDGRFDLEKLLRKNICHQGIFYNISVIRSVGYYNTAYKLCADWDYNLRCWAANEFLYIDKIIACFNAGGETTITNADPKFSGDFVANAISYFGFSVFDPLINRTTFPFYPSVLALQRQKNPWRYYIRKLKSYLNFSTHES